MLLLIRSALHFTVTVPRGGIMALGNGKGSMTPAPWPLLGRVGNSASPHHCTEWGRTDRGQRRRWTDGQTENKKGNSAEFAESQRTDGQKDACNFASPPSAPSPSTLMMTLLMIENIVPGTHGMARIGRVHGIALVVVVRGA